MQPKTAAHSHDARPVSIKRAAEILGVNRATLRHWADQGKVRSFTTPGGHRRFHEEDLVALVETQPPAAGSALAGFLLASRDRYELLARRCLAESEWFRWFDDLARRRFRILGSSMLSLIAVYLTGRRREREKSLQEGKNVATEHGAEAARSGLTLTEATEAFLLFRGPVLDSINRWVRERQPPRREADEVLRRAQHFMDQVLVAMASSHERYTEAHPHRERS